MPFAWLRAQFRKLRRFCQQQQVIEVQYIGFQFLDSDRFVNIRSEDAEAFAEVRRQFERGLPSHARRERPRSRPPPAPITEQPRKKRIRSPERTERRKRPEPRTSSKSRQAANTAAEIIASAQARHAGVANSHSGTLDRWGDLPLLGGPHPPRIQSPEWDCCPPSPPVSDSK